MGKLDTLTKEYMSQCENFADVFNYFIFEGRQVLKPEALRELDSTEIGLIFNALSDELVQKFRDALKECVIREDDVATYLILGIENQSDVHYAMCVKNLLYDALNYAKQVTAIAKKHKKDKDYETGSEFLSGYKREDRIKPVITLTIYWKAGKWDAARSLKEMFGNVPEEIIPYLPDYKLHLVMPGEISDFSKFKSEFGKIMKFIASSEDKETLYEVLKDEAYRNMTVQAVKILNQSTGSKIQIPEGKEKVDVCKAIEEIREEGIEKGIEKGIERGIEKGIREGIEKGEIRMLVKLIENGKIDISDAASEMSMSVEEFKHCMENNKI